MKLYVFRYLIILSSTLFFISCSTSFRYNLSHKTPKKPYKYQKFTICDSLQGSLNPLRSCYDVSYYEITVKFDIKKKSIAGNVEFQYKAIESFDSLQIDLYKNMIIDSIVDNSQKLSFHRKCNAVFIKMKNQFQVGEKGSFKVYYHGKPHEAKYPPWEGGFVWKKDKENNPWAGVACEVMGASVWWPVKDHLSDEPDSVRMNYYVPQGFSCISNGVLTDSSTNNGFSKFSWKVHYPINTYNITFYIGKFEKFSISYTTDYEAFPLDFYVLPQNLEKAKDHFLHVPEIIRFFEKKIGPYPWPKDGYKLVESPFAGMEHQSAIAYGNSYKNHYNYPFDYIVLHETAHEWWGNSVSAPDYSEVWIHEGFATYSEALYVENIRGYESYLSFLRFYAMLIKNKKPIVGPSGVNFWDYKDSDVYMKGALLLHTLRNTMRNDSLFFDIFQEFYRKFSHNIAVSSDFISLVNQRTGQDYTAFFNQYLYSRVCPELEWEYFYNSKTGKNEMYYRWSNAVEGFTIPIKIKTGSRTFVIKPTNKIQKSELPVEKSIVVNTDGSYIASKRTNKFE